MDARWEAVVIGSGIGGLAAAAALSHAGRRVLVLERHTQPGGLTQTFERAGFRFNVGVALPGRFRRRPAESTVRSPVLNIKNACLGCHKKHDAKITENELKARVEQIQDRHWNLREHAMTALMALIADLKAAKEVGGSDGDLATARYLQRRAQFYLDFVEAENSSGFHAPQEAARILGESLNYARQGQIAVRDRKFVPTVPVVEFPAPAGKP